MVSSNELMDPGSEMKTHIKQVHYVQPYEDTLKAPR
jgi:hypothetical protein